MPGPYHASDLGLGSGGPYANGPSVNLIDPAPDSYIAEKMKMQRDYDKANQRERVYQFWNVIQQLDNVQDSMRRLNFQPGDASLDQVMDALVKQWMIERRK